MKVCTLSCGSPLIPVIPGTEHKTVQSWNDNKQPISFQIPAVCSHKRRHCHCNHQFTRPKLTILLVFCLKKTFKPATLWNCAVLNTVSSTTRRPFFLFLLKISESIQSRFNLFTFRTPPSPFFLRGKALAVVQKTRRPGRRPRQRLTSEPPR